jgi:hypothetical protein
MIKYVVVFVLVTIGAGAFIGGAAVDTVERASADRAALLESI